MSAGGDPERDRRFMGLALDAAAGADHWTSPNPMVGAVVVRDGEAVATGFHRRAGEPHAEAEALARAGERARGADLYVTLEPCTRQGRTPPCVDAIVAAGVARCVVAMIDPNPREDGRGVERLRAAGVDVEVGVEGPRAARLNQFYVKHTTTGLPFVTVKFAMSLDGRTATRTGESRWITSEESRLRVHRMRHAHDAVIAGSGTVLRDDPSLTTRLPEGGRSPLRVILDTRLRVPLHARVLSGRGGGVLLATGEGAEAGRRREREEAGVEVAAFPVRDGHVDIAAVLRHLGERGCLGVLVEGGATVHGSVLDGRLADRVVAFVAPLLIGGAEAPGAVAGLGVDYLDRAVTLRGVEVERSGPDVMVTGYCR